MKRSLPLLLTGLLPLQVAASLPLRAQEFVVDAPVRWEPVVETESSPPLQADPTNGPAQVVWELVPERNSSGIKQANPLERDQHVVWELVPNNPQLANTPEGAGSGESNSTQVVWEVIPGSVNPLAPTPSSTLAKDQPSAPNAPPADAVSFEQSQPQHRIPPPPPPPPLQALNRSIAFGDGSIGPDIGWRVPNGFRWSRRWFGDATLQAISRRKEDDKNWFSIGSGDGEAIVHANVLQTDHWSLGLNHSFRSVQNNPNIPGGTTGLEDGMSTGFRIARAIGDTGGIAFGAEQLIQWDDQTDTGRNIYVMASKGWWLGNQGKDFPLLIANGGLGTGKFSYDQSLKIACIYNVENRSGSFVRDNDLCWSPIGTLAIVFNQYFSVFTEYNGTATTLSASLNLSPNAPIRLTGGLSFADSQGLRDFYKYRWTVGASIGF